MSGRGRGGVTVVLAAGALWVVGCSLVNEFQEVPMCLTDADCDDGNPCTEGACSADGICNIVAFPDSVLDQQTAYDCQTMVCQSGQVVTLEEPADKPVDEPCLRYDCIDAALESAQVPAGDFCEVDGIPGTCTADGACDPGCLNNSMCDDGNACTLDSCELGTGFCVSEPLNGSLAPGSQQVVGDCQQILCQDGVEVETNDDTDLPEDDNDCTLDQCNEGVPTNAFRPANFACTGSGQYEQYCDDMGSCIECSGPSQCSHLPSDTFCTTRICTGGVCGLDYTASNTATPAQQPNDCSTQVCDGAGGLTQSPNPSDVPNDNNDCTQDICTGMTPSHPSEPTNTPCGSQGTLYCDGSSICVGCTTSSQCPVDVFCRDYYCNGQQECDHNDTANNTPLPSQDQTPADCQELQCNGIGSVKVVNDNDPSIDGNECTSDLCTNGVPSNPPVTDGTLCTSNGQFCDGVEQCQSGSCTSSGNPCGGVDGDGDCSEMCREAQDDCAGDDPNGATCDDGLFCTDTDQCSSGSCLGSGDPCDGPDSDADCSETCQEPQQNCDGYDPNGSPCPGGQCTSGTCL